MRGRIVGKHKNRKVEELITDSFPNWMKEMGREHMDRLRKEEEMTHYIGDDERDRDREEAGHLETELKRRKEEREEQERIKERKQVKAAKTLLEGLGYKVSKRRVGK